MPRWRWNDPAAVVPPAEEPVVGVACGGRRRPGPRTRAPRAPSRSGGLTWVIPSNCAGSHTSRSSGATLKSPHTATRSVRGDVSSRYWPQPGQPGQLGRVVLAVEAPPVGDVDREHPHPAAVGGDQPGPLVVVRRPRDPGHVVEADPADDGHPVPPAVAVVGRLVAEGGEGPVGEGGVGLLGLLEAQHVGLGRSRSTPRPGAAGRSAS